MRKLLAVLSALVALAPRPAAAWGHHYLVTDEALRHPAARAWAEVEVAVEPFERFAEAELEGLRGVFSSYADWQRARGQARFSEVALDGATREAFLRAARLNPVTQLPLVARRLPAGPSFGTSIPATDASRYLVVKDPIVAEVEATPDGTKLPARVVMATYSDEPDWGFDHELWGFAEYGYGEQPYGKAKGESSKAAFHMLFLREPLLVRLAAPKVLEGMVLDRVELFARLARLAFAEGHDYWGWRFTAWTAHYVQDLCQPYHSRAVPGASTGWYIRYIFSGEKDRMESEATQLASNRHFVYEDFVAYGLQEAARARGEGKAPDPRHAALAGFLSTGDVATDAADASTLVETAGVAAAKHARALDRTLVSSLGPRLTEDPSYDVETAPDYGVAAVLAALSPDASARLLDDTGLDFAQSGQATRAAVAIIRGD